MHFSSHWGTVLLSLELNTVGQERQGKNEVYWVYAVLNFGIHSFSPKRKVEPEMGSQSFKNRRGSDVTSFIFL